MDTQIYTGTHTLLPSSTATFRDMGTQRHSWTEGQTNIDTKVHKDGLIHRDIDTWTAPWTCTQE